VISRKEKVNMRLRFLEVVMAAAMLAGCASGSGTNAIPAPQTVARALSSSSVPMAATIVFNVVVPNSTILMTATDGSVIFSGTCVEGARLTGGHSPVGVIHTDRACVSGSNPSDGLTFHWNGLAKSFVTEPVPFDGQGNIVSGTGAFANMHGQFSVVASIDFDTGTATETWTGGYNFAP
jgi:hypothetical protein